MSTLRQRLQKELGNWHERLPAAWRPKFKDVALDFDAVDENATLADDEAIWPQEGSSNKAARLFKALEDLRPQQVRVVIFGNDPYTRITQATGRSFEQGDLVDWKHDIRIRKHVSPSIQSIIAAAAATDPKNARYDLCDARMLYDQTDADSGSSEQPIWFAHVELARGLADGAIKLPPPTQIFRHWAKQGVLWLNRSLTYTKWADDHRESHRQLWALFTARMLEVLVGEGADRPIVFVLWGGPAGLLEPQIYKLAADLKVPRKSTRCCKSGHPQWPAKYFEKGNPLAAINKAIGNSGKLIAWT